MTIKYATGLPLASNANLTDQIQAVQSNVDTQQTWQLVLELFQKQIAFQTNNGFYQVDLSASDVALSNPAPTLIEITASVSGRSILLPPANESDSWPTGIFSVLIYNPTANDIIIKDATGTPIGSVNHGVFTILAITDNSTAAGSYIPFEFGDAYNLSVPVPINAGGSGATTASEACVNYGALQITNNLSEIPSPQTAASNIGLGINNIVQFARLLVATNSPLLEIYDNRAASTLAIGKLQYLQNDLLGNAYSSGLIQAFSTDVSSTNKTSVLQAGVFDSGVFVTDALTLYGAGLLDTQLNFSNATKLTNSQTNLQIIGTQNMPIFFQPANISGAIAGQSSFSNGVNLPYIQFAQSGLSYAEAILQMPKRWNGGTFTLEFPWYTTPTTGAVVWNVDATVINPNSGSLNPTFGTAVTVTSTANATTTNSVAVTTAAITPNGTPTTNSILIIRLYRNGGTGSDTLASTAQMINTALLNWTSNAGNDA